MSLKGRSVAISACLLGCRCRYDASDNRDDLLLRHLEGATLIPFCPEDDAFGSPRPTMDLIVHKGEVIARSNETGEDLSAPILSYAEAFFEAHPTIEYFVGKDRSPSCGVRSAKIYNEQKQLIARGAGLMAQVAMRRGLSAWDAEAVCNSSLFYKKISKNF